MLDETTGLPKKYGTRANYDLYFFNYSISTLLLNKQKCSIIDINGVPDGCSLNVYCYDADYNFIKYLPESKINEIPENTTYVRFALTGTGKKPTAAPTIDVRVKGAYSLSKNNLLERGVCHEFTFKVNEYTGMIADNKPLNRGYYTDSSDDGNNNWDNGFIMLPPNYDPEGEPVPLVFYCNATTQYMWSKSPGGYYPEYWKFISNCGYAVCACTGMTFKHRTLTNNFGLISYIDSMKSIIDHIFENYNVKNEVYVFGKSAGGFLCLLPWLNRLANVIAAAGFAPTTSTMAGAKKHMTNFSSVV